MISASRPALFCAFAVAVAAHGLGLHGVFDDEEFQMEGGATGVEASLGNSFADMTAGTIAAQPATEVTEPETIDDAAEPEINEDPIEPETSDQVREPVEPERNLDEAERPRETARDEPVEAEPKDPETVVDSVAPEETAEVDETPLALTTTVPISPIQATELEPVEAVRPEPAETLDAVEENTSAVVRSMRPKPRTPEFEVKHKPAPQPRQAATQPRQETQQPQSTVSQQQGNSEQDATVGSATGTRQQKNTASGTGVSTQTGNAAVSDYPGKVMRRLSRVPRPRYTSKGTAVVRFRVSSNGGLAEVSLARSSGNARLDQDALRVVRRAAPFPPPPPGAQRNFSINIKGI